MKTYRLSDPNVFRTLNGLWTGKKEPLVKACVLRNTNFGPDGILDPSDVAKLQVEKRQLDKRQLERGDIILERSGGSPKQPVGRVAFFDLDSSEPFSFSNFTSALRVLDRSLFEPLFVHYFLLDFYLEGGTKPLQSNTTGLRNLNFDSYLQTAVPCPPIDEQRKIAAVLGKVQAAVAVEGDLVRVARELKQAALRQLFTRGLRREPQKQSPLGAISESWVEVRVDALGEVVTGTTPKTAERDNYEGGTFDFISPGDISIHGHEIRSAGKKITEAGMKKSRVLPKGTSCFVCIGSTIGKVGITTQERSATNQQINAVIPAKDFDPYFVFYTLLWNSERIASRASPSPVPIMSKSLFSEPLVWVTRAPAEQREIAALLATLDAKIAHHEARQALLRELFRTLLHDLLTARRRVTSLDFSNLAPASP